VDLGRLSGALSGKANLQLIMDKVEAAGEIRKIK